MDGWEKLLRTSEGKTNGVGFSMRRACLTSFLIHIDEASSSFIYILAAQILFKNETLTYIIVIIQTPGGNI